MICRPALALTLLIAAPALAQDKPRASTDVAPGTMAENVAPAADGAIARGKGALLRGLDKVSGQTTDLPLNVGDAVKFGRLEVRLAECRYPAADKDSDAFAELTVVDAARRTTLFTGWMIASSPALSALDDARYDVWVVACNDGTGTARPDLTYVPDTAAPEGGEGVGPDGTAVPAPTGDAGDSDQATIEAEGGNAPSDAADAPPPDGAAVIPLRRR